MAIYPKGYTTYAGLDLIAKSAASGEALTFTDFVYGDGDVPSDILALTKIVNQKASTPVGTLTNKGDGAFEVTTTLVNDSVENGFFIKEVGVMAKVGDMDPVLFWYTNGGNYVDYCPKAGTLFDPHPFGVTVITSNATSVTVNPVYDSIVNQVEFSAHDNNADAHAALASTINALLAPSKDTDTVRNLLSYLANRYTKAAGVDDWKTDPATTLAALNAFVSNCASGSDVTWSGKKFTNSRLGITGLMDSNGYVSFGPNFGGLIIQWGNSLNIRIDALSYKIPFNVAMSGYSWSDAAINNGDIPDIVIVPYIQSADANGLQVLIDYEVGHNYVPGTAVANVLWMAIGLVQ